MSKAQWAEERDAEVTQVMEPLKLKLADLLKCYFPGDELSIANADGATTRYRILSSSKDRVDLIAVRSGR